MQKALLFLLVLLPASLSLIGCGLIAPDKTSDEDKEKMEFAEKRRQAAAYYDGGQYIRAASQFKLALDIRPEHFMTQLGYAYSLTGTRFAPNIKLSIQFMKEEIGKRDSDKEEVRRIYGLAEAHRLLAMFHRRRATQRESKGLLDEAAKDTAEQMRHARLGVDAYDYVLVIDKRMVAQNIGTPYRVSATLAPLAHIGISVCSIMLGDRQNQAPIARAVKEINQYATTAAIARKYWETRREKTMDLDPLKSAIDGVSSQMATVDERKIYEQKIKNTVEKEAIVRQALVETYMYLERFDDAIAECTRILELDSSRAQSYFYRARCYALMDPPKWASALENMKSFQSHQNLNAYTEEVIRVNQLIRQYEKALRKQKREDDLDLDAG